MVTEVPVEKNEDVPATEALAGLMPAPPTRFYPASTDTSRPASSWEISIPGTPHTPVSSLEVLSLKGSGSLICCSLSIQACPLCCKISQLADLKWWKDSEHLECRHTRRTCSTGVVKKI